MTKPIEHSVRDGLGERITRTLLQEALAQGSQGTALSNAMLRGKTSDFALRGQEASDLHGLPRTCLDNQRTLLAPNNRYQASQPCVRG